jgi:hypothetical protein
MNHTKSVYSLTPSLIYKRLPKEMEELIWSFVPRWLLPPLCKQFYIKYHKHYKIPTNRIESCIRDIVRRDCDLAFHFILKERYNTWIQRRPYRYKDLNYKNYVCFLEMYCIQQFSPKCRKIIQAMNEKKQRTKGQK